MVSLGPQEESSWEVLHSDEFLFRDMDVCLLPALDSGAIASLLPLLFDSS